MSTIRILNLSMFLLLGLLLSACSPAEQTTTEPVVTEADATDAVPIEQYSAETFFATTTLFGSSVSHDNSAVLVTSDADGIFNVYSYPLNGSAPTQLTTSESDANRAVSWFPNDKRFLFTADQGGNELNHLFVQDTDRTIFDLTPGEKLKAEFLGWREDDQAFYVMTNERDPANFDIYRYQIEDYSRELVFENTAGWAGMVLSPSGQWLALARVNSNTDTDLFLLDLSTDATEPQLITDVDGDVSHSLFGFTPDNQALIYGTDGQGSL